MKNLKLTRKQFKEIEAGEQVEVEICGFPAYCVASGEGDFVTPNGVLFEINIYTLTPYQLKINGYKQFIE